MASACRGHNRIFAIATAVQREQSFSQIRMKRNSSTVPQLCRAISEFDQRANAAIRVADHVPGQIGNLSSPQPGLGRQQNDDAISEWVTGRLGEQQEIADVFGIKYLGLLA